MNWTSIGDSTHFLTMVNSCVFAYTVVMYNDRFFDPTWRPEGFCVMNKEIPFFNSHDLCLYTDTVLSIVVGILYLCLKDAHGMSQANELVKFNIFGIFAHGVGHGAISKGMRDGVVLDDPAGDVPEYWKGPLDVSMLKQVGWLFFFWIMLLKATMTNVSFLKITPLAIASAVVNTLVRPQFGFTFVQTILLVAFSLNQLMRPKEEKGKFYALYPMIIGFPLSMIAWLESTQCSNVVIRIGGHLIYDAYIPISLSCYYLICWNMTKNNGSKVKNE